MLSVYNKYERTGLAVPILSDETVCYNEINFFFSYIRKSWLDYTNIPNTSYVPGRDCEGLL